MVECLLFFLRHGNVFRGHTYRAVIHAGPDEKLLQFSPSQANALGAQGSPIQFFFNAYFVRIAIMALAVHMEKRW